MGRTFGRPPAQQVVITTSLPPLLVVIGGPPATGKTTLGKQLAADTQIPFIHKDGIKETLFDRLGSGDREWSRTLGLVSYDLLYHFAEALLAAQKPVIIESNFSPEPAAPVFAARSLSGTRHKGHNDDLAQSEFAPVLRAGKIAPIPFAPSAELVTVDTTDFSQVDYPALLARVLSALPAIY